MGNSAGFPKGTRTTERDPRIERLIAVARVVLVALTLLALNIDPLDPPANHDRVILILLSYVAIASAFAIISFLDWRAGAWRLVTHVADVGMAALLLQLSSLSVSPFFSYFVFVLLAGTLRWNSAGAIWTTAGAFILYVAIVWIEALGSYPSSSDSASPLNRAVVQATFLLVAGALLAFFGRLHERNRSRLAQLADWPAQSIADARAEDQSLESVLRHAAAVMKSPRIVVLWREADEPFVAVAAWSKAGYTERRERDADLDSALDAFDAEKGKICPGAFAVNASRSPALITADGRRVAGSAPIPPVLVSRFAIDSACTAAFREGICRGRVFLLDRENWSTDDVVLTEIVAARIGAELEQHALRQQVEDIGAVRERARLARDLHDGTLQNLTAVRLRLAALERDLGAPARETIHALAELMRDEQRRIREFVDATRQPAAPAAEGDYRLGAEVRRLIAKARKTWGCDVGLAVQPEGASIPSSVGRELGLILTECLANAIRHGQASRIDIELRRRPDRLLMHIRNDGAPIDGRLGSFDLRALEKLKLGPRSVRERIASLGGTMLLTNRPEGVELEMSMPLP
jgi:signal transduction histidine kinase